MNIGIFDSGLGGLLIFKKLIKEFPEHNFVYLGDIKRLPYGNRSDEVIFDFTKSSIEYLFDKKKCELVIIACNTASAKSLRRIQREVLPIKYFQKRVLGVIIPTVEKSVGIVSEKKEKRIGILATMATVNSGTYKKEIIKLEPKIKVYESPAPSLVTLIENGEIKYIEPILKKYLKPLLDKKIDTLILGCTHYPIIKGIVKKNVPKNVKIISQDDIIPGKLRDYLSRHTDIDRKIKKEGKREVLVTEVTDAFKKTARRWFGKGIQLELVGL